MKGVVESVLACYENLVFTVDRLETAAKHLQFRCNVGTERVLI